MELYGLRVGERDIQKSLMFFMEGFDETTVISYYFWCIKTEDKVVLIDTGFGPELAEERKVREYESPKALLKQIGVEPEDVDVVLLTHLHWDHFGGYAYYPNAHFYVQDKEWRFATGKFSDTIVIRQFYDNQLLETGKQLMEESRLTLIDNIFYPATGIQLLPLGGHTPGSQVIIVEGAETPVVFCGDLGYFYRNFEEDNPPMVNLDIPECLEAYRLLRHLAASKEGVIIPGHDPVILDKFERHSERIVKIG